MQLVDRTDLATALGRHVDDRTAALANRVVAGWLRPRVRSTAWPPDRESDLWSAALELCVLWVDNPSSMRSSATEGATDEWASSARRAEILADVEQRYGGAQPLGSFPAAAPWPDDASRRVW